MLIKLAPSDVHPKVYLTTQAIFKSVMCADTFINMLIFLGPAYRPLMKNTAAHLRLCLTKPAPFSVTLSRLVLGNNTEMCVRMREEEGYAG